MAKKQQQQAAGQKGERNDGPPGSGPIELVPDTDPPRVVMGGKCVKGERGRGDYTIITQTNGQPDTIRYPKNVGQCGPLTILCLDGTGRPIPNSDVTLAKGHSLRQFSAGGGRHFSIAFYCTHTDKGGECKIEFDR